MAAPVPPRNPLVAWLQASAAVAQPPLYFDVALANASPEAVGRPAPGANAATNPHTAPPSVAIAPPPGGPAACQDRNDHVNPPGSNPCAGPLNLGPLGPPVWPRQNFPMLGLAPAQVPCQHIGMVRGIFHGPGYQICRHCVDDVRNQPWSTAILNDATIHPPAGVMAQPLTVPGGPGAPGAWTQFLTRMCVQCERQEIKLLVDHVNAPANVPPGALARTPRGPGLQDLWPYVTCTCLEKWHEHCTGASDVCLPHRWREACAKHDELLITRAQNDSWLRDTIRDKDNPNRVIHLRPGVPGYATTLAARVASGIYRACRCGETPSMAAVPQVYQCLGCEGIVHVAPPPPPVGGVMALPPGFPTVVTRRRKRAEAGGFALRRERT